MKSFVYSTDGVTILYRVQARDNAHAIVKLKALYDIWPFDNACVMTHADYCAERDSILEPQGKAPWQRKLNRETPRSAFGI